MHASAEMPKAGLIIRMRIRLRVAHICAHSYVHAEVDTCIHTYTLGRRRNMAAVMRADCMWCSIGMAFPSAFDETALTHFVR